MDLTKTIPSAKIVNSSETTNVIEISNMGAIRCVEASFSVELRSNILTEKGVETRITNVSNVLSFRCICSTCGKDFLEQTSIESHMKSHLQSDTTIFDSGPRECIVDSEPRKCIFDTGPRECTTVNTKIADITANEVNESSSNADPNQSDRETDSSDTIITGGVAEENREVLYNTASDKTDESLKKNQKLSVSSVDAVSRQIKRAGCASPISHVKNHARISEDNDDATIKQANTCSALVSTRHTCINNESSPTASHRITTEPKNTNKTKKMPFECNICGRKLFGKKNYSEHMNMHTGAKPYECSVCGHTYRRQGDLNEHSRVHRQIALHTCPECGKQFTKASSLETHSTIHTGEKPYKCSICDKQFRQKISRDAHMRAHSGERPHLCNICGKTFTRSSHLKRHSVVHMEKKPHQCETCGRRFSQLFYFKVHLAKHNDLVVKRHENPVTEHDNLNTGHAD